MENDVQHDTKNCRFWIAVDGQTALADYRLSEGASSSGGQELGQAVMVMHHTVVPAAHQGRGVAAALVVAAMTWARSQELKVVPQCSYVQRYMDRHPEWDDLRA